MTSWRQVYYDDRASLKARLGMVNEYGLRGAGIWALGYDGGHPELYRAFAESFLVDKSAPQAGIELLSTTQPDEGFVVTWAARDVSSIVSYDVQVSVNGGAWVDLAERDPGHLRRLARSGTAPAMRSASGPGTARATPASSTRPQRGTRRRPWPSAASDVWSRTACPTGRVPTPRPPGSGPWTRARSSP